MRNTIRTINQLLDEEKRIQREEPSSEHRRIRLHAINIQIGGFAERNPTAYNHIIDARYDARQGGSA